MFFAALAGLGCAIAYWLGRCDERLHAQRLAIDRAEAREEHMHGSRLDELQRRADFERNCV